MQSAQPTDSLFFTRQAAFYFGMTLRDGDSKAACEQLPHLAATLAIRAHAPRPRRPDLWLLRYEFKRLAAAIDESDPGLARIAVRGMLQAAGMAA